MKDRKAISDLTDPSEDLQRSYRLVSQARVTKCQTISAHVVHTISPLIERLGQIARVLAQARQRFQPKAPGDEFKNRRRIVRCVIHGTLAGER